MLTYAINLPFPVSANRLWRSAQIGGRGRVYCSPEYAKWKKAADGMLYEQLSGNKRPQRLGMFRISIILGRQFRGGSNGRSGHTDGDNRIKAVLDWCQRAGLVEDDKLCEGGTWQWGEAPSGCRVTLEALDGPAEPR